jgi:hypothetical protein
VLEANYKETMNLDRYNEYYKYFTAHIKAYQIWEGRILALLNDVSEKTGAAVAGFKGEENGEGERKNSVGGSVKIFVTDTDLLDRKKRKRYLNKLDEKRKIRETWEKQQAIFEGALRSFFEVREWATKTKLGMAA